MTDGRLDDFRRRLTALEDERDIARLLASYGPLVDAGDADGAAALWATDGVYDVGDWRMAGRAKSRHGAFRRPPGPQSPVGAATSSGHR